ncbi:MAG: MarR family transcriptional regulator [Chloroflexi bacterium]|nr:MarR family transcriptional regulator [Chloroflexota bacterium]
MTNQVISEMMLPQKASEVFSQFAAELGRYSAAELLRLMQREELSMPRAVALTFLARKGALSISDISTYLNLSLGNTSHIVDQMVCSGYVTRTEDANDRRLKQVMLTAKGQAFVAEIEQVRIEELARRLQYLPAPLLASALTVITEVLEHLRPENGVK